MYSGPFSWSSPKWDDGAGGSLGDPVTADEIWAWDSANNGYVFAFLWDSRDGSTPSMDGLWIDEGTGIETTVVLGAGMGWWYHSKGDDTRTSWTWTEPVGY